MDPLSHSELGKKSYYSDQYNPELLFPVSRHHSRQQLGIDKKLPFHGVDLWNAYELSWLNQKGKPEVARAEFCLPCTTPCLVESKSIKLYLNSYNQTQFASRSIVQNLFAKDMSAAAQGEVTAKLLPLTISETDNLQNLGGICIDDLDVMITDYSTNPHLLSTENESVAETLVSHLLKSNCPVTGQPDWGSVQINYAGKKISHESLLKYIVSYRQHDEFHEQCVERIFVDIMQHCAPEKLTVYARYTRRGGLDINPFRSNFEKPPRNTRLIRQ